MGAFPGPVLVALAGPVSCVAASDIVAKLVSKYGCHFVVGRAFERLMRCVGVQGDVVLLITLLQGQGVRFGDGRVRSHPLVFALTTSYRAAIL